MSSEYDEYEEFSRLVWKEFVRCSREDKASKELFSRDETYLHYLGNQYVKELWGALGGIYECLDDVSEKTRMEVFKILVKEYFRKHKIKPLKKIRRNITDKEWEDIKREISSK